MKFTVHPEFQHLRQFVGRLPEEFEASGEVLHDGRNKIRAYEVSGEQIVVKRYKRPNWFNRIVYTFFRKNKAQHAYEHAIRLSELGFITPTPIAWGECRKNGLIADTYFVSGRTNSTPLSETTAHFPAPETLPVLDAFVEFVVKLHEKGVAHKDFNQTNILYNYDPETKVYLFELIDINRMKFADHPLSPNQSMITLRRLSCPAISFLYILDHYAEARRWDIDDTLLRGTYFRLLFGRRQQLKKRFKARKAGLKCKKAR